MTRRRRQSGVTLIELLVVVGVVAALAFLGVPSVRALLRSLETGSGARSMINAALASARAIAAREQRYAGIRFQKAYDPEGPLEANQYMIFIVHDPAPAPYGTDLANGFRAVEGIKPIRLPESVGTMDLKVGSRNDMDIQSDTDFVLVGGWPAGVADTTTFSIVFSPSGKLVVHDVQTRNRNGRTTNASSDDVFNTKNNVDGETGLFYQDDYRVAGYGREPSRTSFIIYEREKFARAYEAGTAMSGYLGPIAQGRIYINRYTGRMILPY